MKASAEENVKLEFAHDNSYSAWVGQNIRVLVV